MGHPHPHGLQPLISGSPWQSCPSFTSRGHEVTRAPGLHRARNSLRCAMAYPPLGPGPAPHPPLNRAMAWSARHRGVLRREAQLIGERPSGPARRPPTGPGSILLDGVTQGPRAGGHISGLQTHLQSPSLPTAVGTPGSKTVKLQNTHPGRSRQGNKLPSAQEASRGCEHRSSSKSAKPGAAALGAEIQGATREGRAAPTHTQTDDWDGAGRPGFRWAGSLRRSELIGHNAETWLPGHRPPAPRFSPNCPSRALVPALTAAL